MTSAKRSFLLAQLQQAIDEAVTESQRVLEIVEEMKQCGYNLSFMLESTITISPTEDSHPDAVPEPRLMAGLLTDDGEIELSAEDLEFLQELNIAA